jgi:hypothetical protein
MNAFAVVSVVNGNFKVESEWSEDKLDQARMAFHEKCRVLWNAPDVITAVVRLVDRNFLTFTNYVEEISHPEEVKE